jgi:predicted transcriptional regulator
MNGEFCMKKQKSKKKMSETFEIKTGSVDDFFSKAKSVMKAADRGESIQNVQKTFIFEDPMEMFHFLSATKLKLIYRIRKHPDSITNIAKAVKRNRAAVYRDINELEKAGILKTHEEVNPGHGRHKIVELVAPFLKFEASI